MFLYAVAALAAWRIAHMILHENGPYGLFRRLRRALGVRYDLDDENRVVSFRYEITVCMWCLSVWAGAVATLLVCLAPSWLSTALLAPFAISTVCVMLDHHFGMGMGR